MKRLLIPAAAVLLICVGAIVGLTAHSSGPVTGPVKVGADAPDFGETAVDGKFMSLHEQRGRPVLLNFFATWCTPCRSEMHDINRVYRSDRKLFQVLAIDKEEPRSDVDQFAGALGLSFPLLLDSNGSVFTRYGVTVQPVSFWVDREGKIAAIHYGPMSTSYIRREVRKLSAG